MRIARDYATPSQRTPKKRRKSAAARPNPATPAPRAQVSSGFAWLSGFASGAVSVAVIWYLTLPDTSPEIAIPTAAPAPTAVPAAEPTPEATLTFYDELQAREVWVPVVDEYGEATPRADRPAPAEDPRVWQLQAGSFRSAEDANLLRAQLILQGHQVDVQSITLSEGGIWHRVMVGPFDGNASMRAALSSLRASQIDAIPMELRGPAASRDPD